MKKLLILSAILGCGAAFSAQQVINVGASANDKTGDPARIWAQKDNANFAELYTALLANAPAMGGTVNQVVLPSISAPSLPSSGGRIYIDNNGALHYQSQWYDSAMFGGKFSGDASRPWITVPIGIGVTVTGAGNNQPNLRLQKANSSTLSGIEFSMLDTIGAHVTTQETSFVVQTLCPTGNAAYNGIACVGMQVEADKNSGMNGNPFAANFVAKDITGQTAALVAIEADVIGTNPDNLSNLVRVIIDNTCGENFAQTLGLSTCGYGVRTRPKDNNGNNTGPAEIVYAYHAFTESSYPGSFIGNAFASDGGSVNGLNLYSKTVNATTNAQGTSGTPTLTFAIANLPAASPGAWISDGGEGFIPANTTITGATTTAGVTTVTMSANQTGNVANGQAITITQAYDTGILLNGKFNVAARSVTTQYGLEETLQNGLVLAAPTGGAKGVGTLNANGIYVKGAPLVGGTKFTTSNCSISSTTGGAAAGTFTLGANSCTAIITMGGGIVSPVGNGWTCQAHDRTAPTVLIGGENASTTTTANIVIPAGAGATDVISFSCTPF